MTLENTLREVETAHVQLRAVASSAQGWADNQREQFDKQHMKPLDDAAARLIAALQRANEQCQAAMRMLAD